MSQLSEYEVLKGKNKNVQNGGMLITYSGTEKTYISLTGYYIDSNKFNYIGQYSLLWSGTHNGVATGKSIGYLNCTSGNVIASYVTGHEREAITLRCTQESEK